MTYSWDEQKAIGEEQEKRLDAFFSQWVNIEPATKAQQLKGIDRIFTAREYERITWAVEYKADLLASSTSNLFIEIISRDSKGSLGWALRCAADWLVIYVPDDGDIYILHPGCLKLLVPVWYVKYGVGKAQNEGYKTHGLKVPRKKIERTMACMHVLNIDGKRRELGQQICFW